MIYVKVFYYFLFFILCFDDFILKEIFFFNLIY